MPGGVGGTPLPPRRSSSRCLLVNVAAAFPSQVWSGDLRQHPEIHPGLFWGQRAPDAPENCCPQHRPGKGSVVALPIYGGQRQPDGLEWEFLSQLPGAVPSQGPLCPLPSSSPLSAGEQPGPMLPSLRCLPRCTTTTKDTTACPPTSMPSTMPSCVPTCPAAEATAQPMVSREGGKDAGKNWGSGCAAT